MSGKLVEISTEELLEKFGAGNHKPGSGSASAFQGMLSAQMLRTVIGLTLEPKRKATYSKFISELIRIRDEVDLRIYNSLESLFQKDSEQFDKVIHLRELRDKEQNQFYKRALSVEAQEALKIATEIPIEIAELCLELGHFAMYVFDNGFKAARGDSGVALNTAVSGIASCLSIIELNLISLPYDNDTKKLRQQKVDIKSRYKEISLKVDETLDILEKEENEMNAYNQSIAEFRKGNLVDSVKSYSDIEKIVTRLQNVLWLQRDKIWKSEKLENPVQLLKPNLVLNKVMNYVCVHSDSLGIYEQNGELFETAAIINKNERTVQISKKFSPEIQNFTTAHELGHAILHQQNILHRDKAIDGFSLIPRSKEEMQADKFATYFLMPSKLVKNIFIEIFEMPKFIINQNTVFAINAGSISSLKQKCQNLRGLSRLIASTDYYAGKSFKTLSNIFSVSTETMAIRLEELGLVDF